MAHDEPPHQDLPCLQIQLFSSLVVKELSNTLSEGGIRGGKNDIVGSHKATSHKFLFGNYYDQ